MEKQKARAKTLLLFMTVTFSVVLWVSASGQSRRDSKNYKSGSRNAAENQQMPVTPYDTAQPHDRTVKSARFNQPGGEVIDEGVQPLPLITHWWWGMSAFPTERSDAVVIGEVVKGRAYLSSDKTSIYSEFTVQLEKVFKADGTTGLSEGDLMNVERPGGGVQFASGRIHYYRIGNQNLPRVGHRYLLFLKLNDPPEDFSIVTGYELQNGRVSHLDNVEVFEAYDQHPETELLNLVRSAVSRESAKPIKKGGQNQAVTKLLGAL